MRVYLYLHPPLRTDPLFSARKVGAPALDGQRPHIPRAGAALGTPAVAQLNRPLREPSGHLPAPSKAISTRRDAGQRGMQPQTCGTVSPCGGAAPWLRGAQPKVLVAGQIRHDGGDAGVAALTGPCGWTPPPGVLGGGAVPPEMNQVRFCGSQAYASDPQSPYEHVFPGAAQAAPCGGASFGQPSVRAV